MDEFEFVDFKIQYCPLDGSVDSGQQLINLFFEAGFLGSTEREDVFTIQVPEDVIDKEDWKRRIENLICQSSCLSIQEK